MSAEASNIQCRQASLTLPDGVVLKSRLWHPSRGGPWPALLMRQPYGSRIASTVTYAHPHWWASHGFLVVVQDVRGQGSRRVSSEDLTRKQRTPPPRTRGFGNCRSAMDGWGPTGSRTRD